MSGGGVNRQFVSEESQEGSGESGKTAEEARQEIENVQGMIDALPDAGAVTAENLESVKAQITAIDEAKAGLDETQQDGLVLEKYHAVVERIAAVEAEVETARKAEEEASQEAQKKIENVQKMIDALPEAEAVTAGELENVKTQLAAIEEARAGLDEAQQAGLNLDKYNTVVEKTTAMETQSKPQKAPAAVENPVASVTIGGETKYYPSLVAAMNYAFQQTATIKLLQSVNENFNTTEFRGNITLQMNGHSISGNNGGYLLVAEGTLTIIGNGEIDEINVNGGNLIIESGKIKIINKTSGTVTVNGGSIETILGGNIDKYEPTSISLNPTTLSLVVGGESGNLTATIPNISVPIGQTIPYIWSSDDEKIAKVSGNNSANATVTAVKAGTTNIKVQVGDVSATCTVKVKSPQNIPEVTIDYVNESLNTTNAMEYKIGTETDWKPCENSPMPVKTFDWNGESEVEVQFRYRETNNEAPSAPQTVTIPKRPKLTVTSDSKATTASSITISVSGAPKGSPLEYKREGAQEEWQTSNVFDSLKAGSTYTVYARCPATNSSFASEETKAELRTLDAAYTISIPSELTAGGVPETISVDTSNGKKFDLGYKGTVNVSIAEGTSGFDGTVTLERTDKKYSIASELQADKKKVTGGTIGSLAQSTDSVELQAGEPKMADGGIIPAGQYSGTVTFQIAYYQE